MTVYLSPTGRPSWQVLQQPLSSSSVVSLILGRYHTIVLLRASPLYEQHLEAALCQLGCTCTCCGSTYH